MIPWRKTKAGRRFSVRKLFRRGVLKDEYLSTDRCIYNQARALAGRPEDSWSHGPDIPT